MSNILTIELPSLEAVEFVKQFLLNLKFPVKIRSTELADFETTSDNYELFKKQYGHLTIEWPDEEPLNNDLSGIWNGSDITIETIRKKAWKRN